MVVRMCLRCCGCGSLGRANGEAGAVPREQRLRLRPTGCSGAASPASAGQDPGVPRSCEPQRPLARPQPAPPAQQLCALRMGAPRLRTGGTGRGGADGAHPSEWSPYLQCRAERRRLCSLCLRAPERPAGKVAIPESVPAPHQVRGAGSGAVGGKTRVAWSRRGDPFPGGRGTGCSFE